MTYAIIGFGISGMIVFYELMKRNVNPEEVLIFDTDFMGGDLAKYYYDVESNTTWDKMLNAIPESQQIYPDLDSAKTTNLLYITNCLQKLISKNAQKAESHIGLVQELVYIKEKNKWIIKLQSGKYEASTIFLCQGGIPKQLDIPVKTLPLHIALNKNEIKKHLNTSDSVVVFGLAHSGTIILKNLADAGIKHITGIYKTIQPFEFMRDGHYSGIKQESAEIADAILRGNYPSITLANMNDIATLTRTIRNATVFINAIGFETRPIKIVVEDKEINSKLYNPETAEITEAPNCYGFGMAYPSVSVIGEKTYPDISVAAFQQHISRVLEMQIRRPVKDEC